MGHVAVNIVTWNSAAYITTCLDHLALQTYRDFSITIIDNASHDGTVAHIQSWQERPIVLIQNEKNRGFAPAHNQGINHTDSDYVLVLNPDIVMQPDFIAKMIEEMESDEQIGSVSGKLIQLEPEQYIAGEFPPTLQPKHRIDGAGLYMRRNRRQGLNGYQMPALEHFTEPVSIFGPDGAAPLYRRTMLEDIALKGEYFDELFETHKEDVDLAWRAQLRGWKSRLAPEAISYHVRTFRPYTRGNAFLSRRKVDANVRINAVKNRWLMLLKNDRPTLRDLPSIIIYELTMLGYMCLLEQRSLFAIPRVIRLLPEIIERRHITQRKRRISPKQMQALFK